MQEVISTTTRPAISLRVARWSIGAAAIALVLLATLHIISPEFDPSWRMVSEYALGNYGWVLALMFLTWALSCVTLFFVIKPYIRRVGGKIGLGFLLAAAVGMSMAAIFDARHGLHGLAALIGMPSLPIAAVLTSTSLVRNPAWSSARRWLLGTAHLTWISLVLMSAAVFIGLSRSGGEFGPEVLAGWPNRLLVVTYCVWLITTAWWADQLRGQEP
ncbi:MAG: hypothetical protein BroJett011_11550 [Chloroflexota bacterium]|nr:MAG: hypothetical protein BroJett011_11550 [Chloroflexota bacterium]